MVNVFSEANAKLSAQIANLQKELRSQQSAGSVDTLRTFKTVEEVLEYDPDEEERQQMVR